VRCRKLEPGDGGIAAVPADDLPGERVGLGGPLDSELITSRPNDAEAIPTRACGTAAGGAGSASMPATAGCWLTAHADASDPSDDRSPANVCAGSGSATRAATETARRPATRPPSRIVPQDANDRPDSTVARTPHHTSRKPPFGFTRAVLREPARDKSRGAAAGLFVLSRLGEAAFGVPRIRSRYGKDFFPNPSQVRIFARRLTMGQLYARSIGSPIESPNPPTFRGSIPGARSR